MDATETARRSADAIANLPAGFMMDGATYAHGSELGFDGVDFYIAGRGGALGDVSGQVVAATFLFFNPAHICDGWDRSGKVMCRREAALEFAGCGARWAESHLADGIDYVRLAELCKRVIDSASPAGVALFAAWSQVEEPDSPKALALQRLNVLRELRGGLHGAAVLGAGLDPRAAVMVRSPQMASLFGWHEPHPDPELHRAAWDQAEAATDVAIGRAFSALDANERAELVELATEAKAASTA